MYKLRCNHFSPDVDNIKKRAHLYFYSLESSFLSPKMSKHWVNWAFASLSRAKRAVDSTRVELQLRSRPAHSLILFFFFSFHHRYCTQILLLPLLLHTVCSYCVTVDACFICSKYTLLWCTPVCTFVAEEGLLSRYLVSEFDWTIFLSVYSGDSKGLSLLI